MTLQVGGHHAHHGAHPYREAYLEQLLEYSLSVFTAPAGRVQFMRRSGTHPKAVRTTLQAPSTALSCKLHGITSLRARDSQRAPLSLLAPT